MTTERMLTTPRCQRCAGELTHNGRCELCLTTAKLRGIVEAVASFGALRSRFSRQLQSARVALREYDRKYPDIGGGKDGQKNISQA